MKKNNYLYKNASYKLVPSKKTGYVDCYITYKVKGKDFIHFISIKKKEGFNDGDYLRYAKKCFILDVNTKRTKDDKHKASFFLPFIIVTSLFAISAITVGTLYGLGYIGNGRVTPSPTPQKEYTVNFLDSESGATLSEQQKVEYNQKVQRPEIPTKEGYTFDKWYEDKGKTKEYNFDNKLIGEKYDITIYGSFAINTYKVTYITNGGFIKDNKYFVDVNYGNTIATKPEVYKDEQFEVLANATWYLDPGFTNEFTFGTTKVESDLYLYAKYSEDPVVPDNFETDPWEVFLSEISSKSYEDIAEGAYKDEYESSDGKSANTFVGLTRSLDIEDETDVSKNYNITVVDENKNAQIGDSKFTFMITDLNKSMKFAQLKNYYGDSEICLYLNGVLTGFPNTVKTHVLSQTIYCYDPDPLSGSEGGTMKIISSSLYVPSASQVFGKDDTKYPEENSQFAYFDSQEKRSVLNDAWLRTPDQITQQKTLYVFGGNINEDNVDKSHNIMPVFVIK